MQAGQYNPADWEQRARELEKVIAEKTAALDRERQIEAALERVRSRSAGMRRSEEITEIAAMIFSELCHLDLALNRVLIWTFNDAEKYTTWWSSNPEVEGSVDSYRIDYNQNPVFINYLQAWQQRKSIHLFTLSGEAKKNWEDFLFEHTEMSRLPKPVKEGMRGEGTLYTVSVISDYGIMMSGSLEPLSEENINIIYKFGRVFQQSYTRYLDVQKAEAQAKEAEIQLALERVRTRSLAMLATDELQDVVNVVAQQLMQMGIDMDGGVFVAVNDELTDDLPFWASAGAADYVQKVSIPFLDRPAFTNLHYAIKTRQPFYTEFYAREEKNEFLQHLFRHYPWNQNSEERKAELLARDGGYARSVAINRYTSIGITNHHGKIFPEEDNEILRRFGAVLEQSYARFLDLQKAEAQAREAQIEAALERVRSRSMAMHKSEELPEVIQLVFEQLKQLNFNIDSAQFDVNFRESDDLNMWTAIPGQPYPTRQHIPYFNNAVINSVKNAKEAGLTLSAHNFTFKEKNEFFNHFFRHTSVPEERREFILSLPGWARSVVYLDRIYLGIQNYSGIPYSEEEHNILGRFAKAFEQTYTRFLDLQKAEAQAREAQIEAALERIRAKALAMHNSGELTEVAKVLREQMELLGQRELETSAVHLYDEDAGNILSWRAFRLSSDLEGNISYGYFKIPKHSCEIAKEFVQKFESSATDYTIEISGGRQAEWYKVLFKLAPEVHAAMEQSGTTQEIRYYHFSKFSGGALLMVSSKEPSIDSIELQKRAAQVFDLAYRRFKDLQKAEAQAREAEIELGLERVRARAMAMQKSDELSALVDTLFRELSRLDFALNWCIINIIDEPSLTNMVWAANPETNRPPESYLMKFEDYPFHHSMLKGYRERKAKHVYVIEGEEKRTYDEYLFNETEWRRVPNAAQDASRAMRRYVATFTFSNFGGLQTVGEEHLSEQNLDILSRFGKVFDLTYTRFNDLQKAEAQAREAKIETALERVRAQAMAMQHSGDLGKTIRTYFEQLDSLIDSTIVRCGAGLLNKENTIADMSTASKNAEGETYDVKGSIDMRGHPLLDNTYRHWLEQKEYSHILRGNEIRDYYQFITNQVAIPENKGGDQLYFYFPMFSEGSFYLVTDKELPEHELQVFRRFSSVLSLTYRRFNDLQKAEAQAREAQIEAALERVRARTMAMHNSQDVDGIVTTLFDELLKLGVNRSIRSGIGILNRSKIMEVWTVSANLSGQALLYKGLLNMGIHPLLTGVQDAWEAKKSSYSYELTGDDLKKYFNALMEAPEYTIQIDLEKLPGRILFYDFFFPDGHLFIFSPTPVSDEIAKVFMRFASVFGQTYQRYLDLQKAEAQAREAQIEAALEKVRSRSLAMQSPDELMEVAQLLREEMGALGVEALETSSIYLHDESSGQTQCWFTIKDTIEPGKAVSDQMTMDLKETKVGQQMLEFYQSRENQTSILMQGDQRIEWIRYCEAKTDLFGTSNFYGETIPERIYHLYKFSNGFIGAAAPGEISAESWELLKRATAVFSFAYTRFRDLQKAEASARAALRQASLDRVRADISSMRSTRDMDRITPLVWNELTTLGIPFIRCGVFMVDEKKELVSVHLSSPDGRALAVMNLAFDSNDLTSRVLEAWRKGTVYRQHWDKEDFINYGKAMVEQGQVKDLKTYQGDAEAPESLQLHFIPFRQGLLYVGTLQILDNDQIELLTMLARTFAIAYARYEDFVKLEQAKAEVESALGELKATQAQLVQQEKLASLGQLTAGIAHEIKNPLNFVNNFSEVSLELLEEALEELEREPGVRDEILLKENFDHIRSNIKKVLDHGYRANGIVTSMLMHSRGGTGKAEPVPLNEFIKEYASLAYHGMRAGKSPVDVRLMFETDEKIQQVPLIAEDFSRVVLNICHNAFDALRNTPSPSVTIRTLVHHDSVCIEIEDNGPGIDAAIKDKVFQPFFTTKKGKEGTGLGLSISHDIVKTHGGTIRVETGAGKGTIFIISLPVQKKVI